MPRRASFPLGILAALLASLVVPGIAIAQDASPAPDQSPSTTVGVDLAALFPASVGELPVGQIDAATQQPMDAPQVWTDALPSFFGGLEPFTAFEAALAAEGKSLADVEALSGFALTEPPLGIAALRINGVDASTWVTTALPITWALGVVDPTTLAEIASPEEIEGKPVIAYPGAATRVAGQELYIYPKDDVVWIVVGPASALADVFASLP
jgi:hypothetical protein